MLCIIQYQAANYALIAPYLISHQSVLGNPRAAPEVPLKPPEVPQEI
jgi:hypothetical protein